jgi:hypothetical protein
VAILALRPGVPLSRRGHDALARLEPCLLRRSEATEWPGTRLISGTATVFSYGVSDFLCKALQESADALYDWQQPELPEDLCFTRADGTAVLTTVSHECDAFLDIDAATAALLRRAIPELRIAQDDT